MTETINSSVSLPTSIIEFLEENASFVLLGENKQPLGRYKTARSRARVGNIPESNFGVIPSGRLLILDVDAKVPVDVQSRVFSNIFGINLEETMSVRTPSGGKHYYMLAPKEIVRGGDTLPRGSLRGRITELLKKEYGFSIDLDADLRSPQQTGYVVGPGSKTLQGDYVLDYKQIQSIPVDAFEKLSKLTKEHYSTRQKLSSPERSNKARKTKRKKDVAVSLMPVPEWIYKTLKKALDDRLDQSFHAKRAVVKSLLACCHDDETIASVCRVLEINRDTFSNSFISDSSLLKDLRNMSRVFDHGGLGCKHERTIVHAGFYGPKPKVNSAFSFVDRGKRVSKRKYRVISMDKVIIALTKKHRFSSSVVRDAYAIVEHFVQPLSNFGAQSIILAYDKLREYFRMSKSRVAAALRLLREVGFLSVERKPLPGRTTVYYVDDSWNDSVLTKILRKTWKMHVLENDVSQHPSVEFLHRERAFVDALSRRRLFITSEKQELLKPGVLVPGKLGSIAETYLFNEVELRRDIEGEGFVESIEWAPGMILAPTLDDSFFEPMTLREIEVWSASDEYTVEVEVEADLSWRGEFLPLLEVSETEELYFSEVFDSS